MPAVLLDTPALRSRRTLGESMTRVRRMLNVSGANWLSDDDVIEALNDAQDEFARLSQWFYARAVASTVANEAQIALPSAPAARFVDVREVYHNDEPIMQIPLHTLTDYYRRFRTQTAAVPRWWSAEGGVTLYLYPTPTTSAADVLEIHGPALPPLVTESGDFLYVPHGLEAGLLDYACRQISVKDAHGEGSRRLEYFERQWRYWRDQLLRQTGQMAGEVTAVGEDGSAPETPAPGYIPPGAIVSPPV